MANVEVKIVTRVNGKKALKSTVVGEVTNETNGAAVLADVNAAIAQATEVVRAKVGV